MSDASRWQFRGHEEIVALADRLLAAQGVRQIEPPKGLGLELRAYQKEGVSYNFV